MIPGARGIAEHRTAEKHEAIARERVFAFAASPCELQRVVVVLLSLRRHFDRDERGAGIEAAIPGILGGILPERLEMTPCSSLAWKAPTSMRPEVRNTACDG